MEYQLASNQLSFLHGDTPEFTDPVQSAIYSLLRLDSLATDQIVDKLSSDAQIVTHALTMMELDGHIRSSGGVFSVL